MRRDTSKRLLLVLGGVSVEAQGKIVFYLFVKHFPVPLLLCVFVFCWNLAEYLMTNTVVTPFVLVDDSIELAVCLWNFPEFITMGKSFFEIPCRSQVLYRQFVWQMDSSIHDSLRTPQTS